MRDLPIEMSGARRIVDAPVAYPAARASREGPNSMQVQVIENRADISGKVREVKRHETLEHYYTVKMDVESVTPVAGMANLMASSKGMTVDVSVPEEQVESKKIVPGAKITLRVKKSGPTEIMAVPPPEKP